MYGNEIVHTLLCVKSGKTAKSRDSWIICLKNRKNKYSKTYVLFKT